MTRNAWIRQAHRWISIAFALAVVANLAAKAARIEAPWLGLVAVIPLLPLLFSGLYLFVLPYAARRRQQPGVGA